MNEFFLIYLGITIAYYIFLMILLARSFTKKKSPIDTEDPLRVAKFMGIMIGLSVIWPATSIFLITSSFFDYVNKYWIEPQNTPPAK